MGRAAWVAFVGVVLLGGVPATALASPQRVYGTVTDGHGHPLQGIELVARDVVQQRAFPKLAGTLTTDASGAFDFTVDLDTPPPADVGCDASQGQFYTVKLVVLARLQDPGSGAGPERLAIVEGADHQSLAAALDDVIFLSADLGGPAFHGEWVGQDWHLDLDFATARAWNDEVLADLDADVARCPAIAPRDDIFDAWADGIDGWQGDHLDSAAAMWHNGWRGTVALETLGVAFDDPAEVAVFEFGELTSAGYRRVNGYHRIHFSRGLAAWDDNNVDIRGADWYPDNREWHELCHYAQERLTGESITAWRAGDNHLGYHNDDTSDSILEGWAEFCAMLIAEHQGDPRPWLYRADGNDLHFELGYPVWGPADWLVVHRPPTTFNLPIDGSETGATLPVPVADYGVDYFTGSQMEELAVASILWDLHDDRVDGGPVGGKVALHDRVSLSGADIAQVFASARPHNLVELLAAFASTTDGDGDGLADVAEIFVQHGAFRDANPRNFRFDGPATGTPFVTEYVRQARAALGLPASADVNVPPDVLALLQSWQAAAVEVPGETGSCVPWRPDGGAWTCDEEGAPPVHDLYAYRGVRRHFELSSAAALGVTVDGLAEATTWATRIEVSFPAELGVEAWTAEAPWDPASARIPLTLPPDRPALATIRVVTDAGETDAVQVSAAELWRGVVAAGEVDRFTTVTLTSGGAPPSPVELSGLVLDDTGEALAGARVTLDAALEVMTQAGGEFAFEGVQRGFHRVAVDAAGYLATTLDVAIGLGAAELTVQLERAAGGDDDGGDGDGDGDETADGGATPPPPDGEPACTCDAAGSGSGGAGLLALLALLVVVARRRLTWRTRPASVRPRHARPPPA